MSNAEAAPAWSPSLAREAVRAALRRYRTETSDPALEVHLKRMLADDSAFDSPEALADRVHIPRELMDLLKKFGVAVTVNVNTDALDAAGVVARAIDELHAERRAMTLRTGSGVLDTALNGGYPRGRIVEICGAPPAGAVVRRLAMMAIHEAREQGHRVVLLDCGQTFARGGALWKAAKEARCLELPIGLGGKNARVSAPATVDDVVRALEAELQDGAVLIVVDDLDATLVRSVKDRLNSAPNISKGFERDLGRIAGLVLKPSAVLMFVGTGSISPFAHSAAPVIGGRGLSAYSSLRIEVREEDYDGLVSGHTALASIRKNKIGTFSDVHLEREIYWRDRTPAPLALEVEPAAEMVDEVTADEPPPPSTHEEPSPPAMRMPPHDPRVVAAIEAVTRAAREPGFYTRVVLGPPAAAGGARPIASVTFTREDGTTETVDMQPDPDEAEVRAGEQTHDGADDDAREAARIRLVALVNAELADLVEPGGLLSHEQAKEFVRLSADRVIARPCGIGPCLCRNALDSAEPCICGGAA